MAVLDRNAAAGESLAAETGGVFCPCDVTDPASVEAAIAKAASAHGPARILVNCAGIGTAARIVGRDGPMPLDAFERVVRVNLIGTFNVMRLAAAAMSTLPETETGERGVIISTASVAAYDGQIGQAAYAASKGGIVSLTLPAAREFCALRHPRSDDRAGPVPHAAPGGAAGGDARGARRVDPLPRAPRRARRIRRAGRGDDRQHLPQRRGRAPRRRPAHGAEIVSPGRNQPPGLKAIDPR